jgi:hypothetical protein
VNTELVKICAGLSSLLFLAAMQDLAPATFGVKPPLLLMFACIAGAPAAIAAGLFTDTLGGLPFGCSAIFYLVAALLSRLFKPFAFLIAVVSAALYQGWLLLWGESITLYTFYIAIAYAIILFPLAQLVFFPVKKHLGIDAPIKEYDK